MQNTNLRKIKTVYIYKWIKVLNIHTYFLQRTPLKIANSCKFPKFASQLKADHSIKARSCTVCRHSSSNCHWVVTSLEKSKFYTHSSYSSSPLTQIVSISRVAQLMLESSLRILCVSSLNYEDLQKLQWALTDEKIHNLIRNKL